MKYKSYGYDSEGKWIDNRKSRKQDRRIIWAYNTGLHSKRSKKAQKQKVEESNE